jgi:hypothetical protein
MSTTSSRGSATASADLLFIFATTLLVITMVAVEKLMRFLITRPRQASLALKVIIATDQRTLARHITYASVITLQDLVRLLREQTATSGWRNCPTPTCFCDDEENARFSTTLTLSSISFYFPFFSRPRSSSSLAKPRQPGTVKAWG